MRYEDDLVSSGRFFSFGLTLDALKIQSTREDWIPAFVTELTGREYFKLVELMNLSIYWDSDDKPLQFETESISSFSKSMQSKVF